MNPVVIAVGLMLVLSLLRINVVVSLALGAIAGGLVGGLSLTDTLTTFSGGLGGGAEIALSYAMLGAFAVAISRSGITDLLASKVISQLGKDASSSRILWVKTLLLSSVLAVSISSQNIIPVHIAFIPILIPPLLHVMAQMQIDRRQVACVITFGLTATYMVLPVGFGGIFLNNILAKNLIDNGVPITSSQIPLAMAIPGCGMVLGLLIAVFFSYRKPRQYDLAKILEAEPETVELNLNHIWVALLAIGIALGLQLMTNSIVLGALAGFVIFTCGGVIKFRESQDAFTRGTHDVADRLHHDLRRRLCCRHEGDSRRREPGSGRFQLYRSAQRHCRLPDAAGGPAHHHGDRFLLLHRPYYRHYLCAALPATGFLSHGDHRAGRYRRCAGGRRLASFGLHPRPHIGPQRRWPARPYLGQRGAHLHPLQYPAGYLRLDCRHGALT